METYQEESRLLMPHYTCTHRPEDTKNLELYFSFSQLKDDRKTDLHNNDLIILYKTCVLFK